MNVIVTDEGFAPDDWTDGYVTLEDAANDVVALDVASDTDPDELIDRLGSAQMVRVDFPSSADGRGFTIARVLRLKGLYRPPARQRTRAGRTNTPWRDAAGSTKSRLTTRWPTASPRISGSPAFRLERHTTIRPACAADHRQSPACDTKGGNLSPFPDLDQRFKRRCRFKQTGSETMTEMKSVTEATAVKAPVLPDAQTVTDVKHWTDSLFSFKVSRPASLAVPLGRVRDDRTAG